MLFRSPWAAAIGRRLPAMPVKEIDGLSSASTSLGRASNLEIASAWWSEFQHSMRDPDVPVNEIHRQTLPKRDGNHHLQPASCSCQLVLA